ncbi:MAG: tol-pal system-associated acyl-CoA thioesterase [Pseudomonadota bacterium]
MHSFPVTVYYEDTDMGGIVYHANYLKFIERGRSDWVRQRGIDQNALRAEGIVFAVRHLEADFLGPARLDERLRVLTQLIEMRGARFVVNQQVLNLDGAALFRARVTLVAMTRAGRPTRLPKALRDRIAADAT